MRPSANQSFSAGTITYTGGSSNYTNLNDSSDATYVQFAGSDSYASYPLTDTPSDMGTVTAVTIRLREARGSAKGDYGTLASVQIFKSNGSTAITSSATATDSTSITNFDIVPSTINFTDKTSWDGAVLKILQGPGTGAGIIIYEAYVTITYTATGGATSTQFMSFLYGGNL